ncbi:hypothetical protein [Aeromonas dhakensis]|uniref:hypothetical protein n=1 Tax=Aeromonas dhakensis TaxID=196024 RepID=UPI003B9EA976
MKDSEKLAHKLKIKYGTAPNEPTNVQIALICNEINKIIQSGRKPTEKDWSDAVYRHCSNVGKYSYSGIDNSDLNTLLALAIQVSTSKG